MDIKVTVSSNVIKVVFRGEAVVALIKDEEVLVAAPKEDAAVHFHKAAIPQSIVGHMVAAGILATNAKLRLLAINRLPLSRTRWAVAPATVHIDMMGQTTMSNIQLLLL
jgi:hypothetical protein